MSAGVHLARIATLSSAAFRGCCSTGGSMRPWPYGFPVHEDHFPAHVFCAVRQPARQIAPFPSLTDSLQGKPAVACCFTMAAFFIWGLFPLLKTLGPTPALQILCHRIVWSAVFGCRCLAVAAPLGLAGGQRCANYRLDECLSPRRCCCRCQVAGYIWAVNWKPRWKPAWLFHINPLVNVLLGRVFLGERPSPPAGAGKRCWRRWRGLADAVLGAFAVGGAARWSPVLA